MLLKIRKIIDEAIIYSKKLLYIRISIKTKLLFLFLSIIILFFLFISIPMLLYNKALIASSNRNLLIFQEKILNLEERIFDSTIRSGLHTIVTDKAELCNTIITNIDALGIFLKEYTEHVYDNTYNNKSSNKIILDPDIFVPKVLKNKLNDPEIIKEYQFLMQIKHIYNAIEDYDLNTEYVQIATKSGLFLNYPSEKISADYNPLNRVWFKKAVETKKPGWTNVYATEMGRNPYRISYFTPVFDKKNHIIAVISLPLSLVRLNDLIFKSYISSGNRARFTKQSVMNTFIFNKQGIIFANYLYLDKFDKGVEEQSKSFIDKYRDTISNGKDGIFIFNQNNEYKWAAYSYIPTTDWYIVVIYSMKNLNQPLAVIKKLTTDIYNNSQIEIRKEITKISTTQIIFYCFLVVVFIFIIISIAKKITAPIQLITEKTKLIGEGNLNIEIDNIKTNDELETLASAINKMTSDLKIYIENLNEKIKAEEKLTSELSLAAEIQKSILPTNFIENDRIDLAVLSHPAKVIGGDYYDFFQLKDNKIGILISDIIGKGIPAALYMVIVESIIHSYINEFETAGEAMKKINFIFCKNPILTKYIPTFYAIIDMNNLKFRGCNAGHEPIILFRDEKFEMIDTDGFPLGAFEEATYEERLIDLKIDDILVFFTDGITECRNIEQVDFGIQQLQDCIKNAKDLSAEEIKDKIFSTITEYSKGAIQHDDLTLLVLKVK